MITYSRAGSVVGWTRRPCAAASSAPVTLQALSRCASTTYGHTYGSLLVAGGIDLPSVKAAMGHSHITTTERYLHARPAGELAERFTQALALTAAAA